MKKLIMMAVVGLSFGAFALCGDAEPQVVIIQKAPTPVRTVYKFAFTGRTTEGRPTVAKVATCGDAAQACIARTPTKFKAKGWIALCGSECSMINGGTADAEAYAFWAMKPYKADLTPSAELDFDGGEFPHVIGKKPNKAEVFGTFKSTLAFADGVECDLGDGLTFAGLGEYKAPIYKKVTGTFVGKPSASWHVSEGTCAQSDVYDCSTLSLVCEQFPSTVIFGKWSMKYSKAASKALAHGKLPKVPAYATYASAN